MIRALLIFLCMAAAVSAEEIPAAVTYQLKTGRFGDQLLAFSHAVWFSHALGIPVYYKPFSFSEQLKLHMDSELIREGHFSPAKTVVLDSKEDYLQLFKLLRSAQSYKGVLFEVPYYPDSTYLYEGRPQAQFTEVNWKDPEFLARLRQLISPLKDIPKHALPADRVPVALHYRSGVGYDKPGWKQIFPLKGPPDDFYADALSMLLQVVDEPLYVYLFTDDPEPMQVLEKFRSRFSNRNIVFACREGPNGHALNVLEDFFGFGDFDCLIRPDSNFSFMAAHLFPFKIIVSPAHFRKKGKGVVIDQFLFEFAPTERVKRPIRTILRKEKK